MLIGYSMFAEGNDMAVLNNIMKVFGSPTDDQMSKMVKKVDGRD